LTGWIGTASGTRTQFYRFKGREYVLASRTLGSSDLRLIFRHILPNSMGTIITGSVLMIPSTIFSEASIAYLQLGLQDKQSFGVMMANNQQYLDNHAYVVIFPAVIMALMMISFNLFGNGLRDAFNPSLKGSD
jgi:oligopeptide transport system permease protein